MKSVAGKQMLIPGCSLAAKRRSWLKLHQAGFAVNLEGLGAKKGSRCWQCEAIQRGFSSRELVSAQKVHESIKTERDVTGDKY